MNIKGFLVSCQPTITWLLERWDTPLLKWICTISPNPMIMGKEGVMLLINMSRFEGVSIMRASRVTKGIIGNEEVMEHNDRLIF
jgi:hypothetical protein